MQIVIDIPEEKYDAIKSNYNTFPAEMKEWGLEAIKNGIVLPKGHGRLIDADEVDTAIYEWFDGIQFYDGTGYDIYQETKESIDNISTIIEADKESEDKE